VKRSFAPRGLTEQYWSAPSGSMGILATTDRGFPSGFSFSFYTGHLHLHRTQASTLLPTFILHLTCHLYLLLLSTYPPVSSLPPRSTYLLERPLHVFVVCSPCCFYEAPYTAPVPYPSTLSPHIKSQDCQMLLSLSCAEKKN